MRGAQTPVSNSVVNSPVTAWKRKSLFPLSGGRFFSLRMRHPFFLSGTSGSFCKFNSFLFFIQFDFIYSFFFSFPTALSNFQDMLPSMSGETYRLILEPCLANALLLDLKAIDLLIPSINLNDIDIDKYKVERAKTKVKTTAEKNNMIKVWKILYILHLMEEWIRTHFCIRKFVEENGQKTMKKNKGPERHLTCTKETPYKSKYLTHKVLPNIGATVVVHAEQVVVLHEFNGENTIKAIIVDNTNANTGCEGAMVAILGKKV